jgi:hypothetical protein
MNRYTFAKILVALSLIGVILQHQNCNKVEFESIALTELSSQSIDSFTTPEDQTLKAVPRSRSDILGVTSVFSQVSQTSNGLVMSFDSKTGEFTYTPNPDFYGSDEFDYSELDTANNVTLVRKISIEVIPQNDKPWIQSDLVSFDMNTKNGAFSLEPKDVEDPAPQVFLSEDRKSSIATPNGRLEKTAAGLKYIPATNFRGMDSHEFVVIDNDGMVGKKVIQLSVGNPFQTTQPAMAARGTACISCHAQLKSDLVTDFGFGDSYYFSKNTGNPNHGVNGHHTTITEASNTYSTSWETMKFSNGAKVIVPQALLPFNLQDFIPAWYTRRGESEWTATNLKDHIAGLEDNKPVANRAAVVEKAQVYIGAPSVQDLRDAGLISEAVKIKYWPNAPDSLPLSGFAAVGNYHSNTNTLECDGDLFVEGAVFLNKLKIKTVNGCRIYATGPIFQQGPIEYLLEPGKPNNSNLQLVSSRLVSMGIGNSHCESAANPGWYFSQEQAQTPPIVPVSPLDIRLRGFWASVSLTRNVDKASGFPQTATTPADEGKELFDIGIGMVGLEDASCHNRTTHFERLMVVAPHVHSRYTGNFKGVIVTENPLFSLGRFAFEFDPVFSKVPVLPMLESAKYLKIQ